MKIKIEKTTNGYIIYIDEEKTVIQEDDLDDKKTITDLLYLIAEHFGFNYDGFSKENLNITWNKKGDEID